MHKTLLFPTSLQVEQSQGMPPVADSQGAGVDARTGSKETPNKSPALADGTLMGTVGEEVMPDPDVRRSSFGRSASRLLGQPEKKVQASDERHRSLQVFNLDDEIQNVDFITK